MKVSCPSCPAKYNIADEKVAGKVVKMRCKKCGATIVIHGNDMAGATPSPAAAEAFSADAAFGNDTAIGSDVAAGGDEGWTVNVDDGDQRTLSSDEIVDAYRSGVVNEETYCWRDGMADWLPLREIDELYRLCQSGGASSDTHAAAYAPPVHEEQGGLGALFGPNDTAEANAYSPDNGFAGNHNDTGPTRVGPPPSGNGGGFPDASAPLFGGMDAAPAAAARRAGGGRGGGIDLFGGVAQAGAEEQMGAGALKDAKLTGQRNESSVLFSLSALTDQKVAEPKTTATTEGSGLIDIRALSQSMTNEGAKKSSGIDDIMNLGGGGAFSAALTAPVLAPLAPEAVMGSIPPEGGSDSNKKMKMIIIGMAGAFVLLLIGMIMMFMSMNSKKSGDDTANASASSSTGVRQADTSEAPTATVAPTATAIAAVDPSKPEAKDPTAITKPSTKQTGGNTAKATEKAPEDKVPDPPKVPAPPKDFGSALAEAAGKKNTVVESAPASGTDKPFDRGAAAAALGSVAVQTCAKPGGPTGGGHVKVTFAPNGTVTSAEVDQGPFPGTPVGGCIAGKYRGVKVPAFSGGAITVGKSFTVN